jgi:tetratricopeptide (TPR) repeat protein
MHDRIREAEQRCSWKTTLRECRTELVSTAWNAASWACVASCLDALGELESLESHIHEHLERIGGGSAEIRSFAFYMIGRLHQSRGEYDLALAAYMRSSALSESPQTRVLPLLQTGTINTFLGAYSEARANLRSALADARQRGDWMAAGHAADFLASISIRVDELDSAAGYLKEARGYAQEGQNQYRLAWINFTDGENRFKKDAEEGLLRMGGARTFFQEIGHRGAELHACARLGACLLATGRLDEASAIVGRGLEIGQYFRHNVSRGRLLALYADIEQQAGRISDSQHDLAARRAHLLTHRAEKSWRLLHGRARIFSETDVMEFLATLDFNLFVEVCRRVLAERLYRAAVSASPFVELIAEQNIETSGVVLTWAVACRHSAQRNNRKELPTPETLRELRCMGLMILATGPLDAEAIAAVETLRGRGVIVDVQDGLQVAKYLADHDAILADVATMI